MQRWKLSTLLLESTHRSNMRRKTNSKHSDQFALEAQRVLRDTEGADVEAQYEYLPTVVDGLLAVAPDDTQLRPTVASVLMRDRSTYRLGVLHLAIFLTKDNSNPAALSMLGQALYNDGLCRDGIRFAEVGWSLLDVNEANYSGDLEALRRKWMDLRAKIPLFLRSGDDKL